MKKSNLFKRSCFLLSSALMVSGAFLATGCSNEVEGTDNGPSNLTGEAVKTQFSISIPYTGNANTRMTDGYTQAAGTAAGFLGMQDIRLIPYALSGTNPTINASSTMDRGVVIQLGDISTTNGLDKNNSSAKVYNDVSIETGTTNFLFYSQAIRSTNNDVKFQQGSLKSSTPTAGTGTITPTSINFELDQIKSDLNFSSDPYASAYIGYLNSIIGVNDGATTGAKTWLSYSSLASGATGSSAILQELYNKFITLKAGSAVGIAAAVEDLYNAVDGIINETESGGTTPTTEAKIAQAIRSAILSTSEPKFTVDGSTNAYPYKLVATTEPGYKDFPSNYFLPEGSVQVTYSNNNFSYVDGTYNIASPSATPSTASYVYPAALWYYSNSTISTSNSSQIDKYTVANTDAGWNILLGNYTAGKTVNTGTRSIAMDKRIKYGVGRLESRVYFTSATVQDNNPNNKDDQGNIIGSPVTINPIYGIPITGIIIGGQKHVGWDFTSGSYTTSTTPVPQFTIYDQIMNASFAAKNTGIAEAASASSNSTLVLETEEKEVNIAIELVNNTGRTIYGSGSGIIPNGAKFYLVGKLDKTATSGVTNPDPTNVKSIFQQGYVTKANFKIGSLKSAYNTLPDLRASQLELGLSVDLSWETGYTFNVTID